jgi:hypothetical protein
MDFARKVRMGKAKCVGEWMSQAIAPGTIAVSRQKLTERRSLWKGTLLWGIGFITAPIAMLGIKGAQDRRSLAICGGITGFLAILILIALRQAPQGPLVQTLQQATSVFFALSFGGGYLCATAHRNLQCYVGDAVAPQIIKAAIGGAFVFSAPLQMADAFLAEGQKVEHAQAVLPNFLSALFEALDADQQVTARTLCVVDGLHGPMAALLPKRTPEQVGADCRAVHEAVHDP